MYKFDLSTKFNYGCFNGCSLEEILFAEPSYIVWSIENIKDFAFNSAEVFDFLHSDLTDKQVIEGHKIFHEMLRKGSIRYVSEVFMISHQPNSALSADQIYKLTGIFQRQFQMVLDSYVKAGKNIVIYLDDEELYNDCEDLMGYEETHTYSRYAGSYAQYEAGFSDEEIDTIFDGDPDMYWNID
jgi:hypothetical protein